MKTPLLLAGAAVVACAAAAPAFGSPFQVSVRTTDDGRTIEVAVGIPSQHRLYADSLKVAGLDGTELGPGSLPPPEPMKDPLSGQSHPFYPSSITGRWPVVRSGPGGPAVSVEWQGCDDAQCFFPERMEWRAGDVAPPPPPAPAQPPGRAIPNDFSLARTSVGYQGETAFLAFLEGRGGTVDLLRRGWVVAIALILGGGLLLNLTPCVLPMIPINLAIIGAGARARSRAEGFALGGLYGVGMCVAYGLLGVAVVRSGAPFGALNASPWFNASIAALFAVLALAMFGAIPLDLSRFQGRLGAGGPGRHRYAGVFALGAVSALLAGACVAPVLISVLLLAASLYQKGHAVALFLPFLLGLGMALPWPFAGAGLARLPPPGRWMDWVKYGFGVFIAAMALYYGRLAWDGFRGPAAPPGAKGTEGKAKFDHDLPAGAGPDAWAVVFDQARREGRPVFVDFWATWCKNCAAMEATTFRQPAIRAALARMITVRYQAERPAEEPARSLLAEFGALGLPTFAILERRTEGR